MAENTKDKPAEGFKNLHEKLLYVKSQVPYLQKDSKGHAYKYAAPELVLGTINPILNELGVMLKSEVVDVEHEVIKYLTSSGKEKQEVLYNIKMLFTWIDAENPEDQITCTWHGAGMNDYEKGYGAALTYGERYFMLKFFNIPTGEDDPDNFQKERSSTGKNGDSFKDKVASINHENIIKRMEYCKTVDELKGLWGGLNVYAQHNEHVLSAKKELKKKLGDDSKDEETDDHTEKKVKEAKEETVESVEEEMTSDDKEDEE